MFYFFERENQFISCEIQLSDSGCELRIVRPDGTEERRRFATEEELQRDWDELQRQILREGWWGPHSRD